MARRLVAPGKGLLAADESFPTIARRFSALGIPSTEETRRAYRDMLVTSPRIDEYLSGVILFDETIRQQTHDGTAFTQLLERRGIVPGIKVDQGVVPFAGSPTETITEGLDGLRDRLDDYRALGARFTKWRAVIRIGQDIPTAPCITANADSLARFAAVSQACGLVPIVEPEVLADGDHGLATCFEVTERTMRAVFAALSHHQVEFTRMLLKPNMVVAGSRHQLQAAVAEVAEATVRCLNGVVPAAIPGIVFLSGGQSEAQATAHLNAMNQMSGRPWVLSFSFGRALQATAMKTWRGRVENIPAGQAAFSHRARLNSAAQQGRYRPEMERESMMADRPRITSREEGPPC
jgi:fructose-bisphosphate aldolase class I